MPLSDVSYTADGATPTFTVTFSYIAQSHVKVYIDGVEDTTFTWDDASTVRPTTQPANGEVVRIERSTPSSSRLVDFQDASILTEADLDLDSEQNFYLMQELLDDALVETPDGVLDAANRRIKNVATPNENADAVTKAYADAIAAAAGNVTTPGNPADDDKVLTASGGTWSWVAMVASRISDATTIGKNILTAASAAAVRALISPLTANSSLWTRTGGVDAELTVGANNTILSSDGTTASWSTFGGYRHVVTRTASASSELIFTDLDQNSEHLFVLRRVLPATDGADLYLQFSATAGGSPSWINGASSYAYVAFGQTDATTAGTVAQTRSGGDTKAILNISNLGNVTGPEVGVSGFLEAQTGLYSLIQGMLGFATNAANLANNRVTVQTLTGQTLRALRFYMSSGNITSGSIAHYSRPIL